MSNETRPEQQTIPAEVMNAELAARLDFTEKRLLGMATVAHNLQSKCNELLEMLAARSEEVSSLQMSVTAAEAKVIETEATVAQRVSDAIKQYDSQVLPSRVNQIQKSPRKR